MSPAPPRWLAWTDAGAAKAIATLAAYVALAGAILLGARGQAYITCVGNAQRDQAIRTAAIAQATDAERAAQRALVTSVGSPAGIEASRAAALQAYDHTDAVRRAYPAPIAKRC